VASSYRVSIQQQETYCNGTNAIHAQFWKASMKMQPYGTDRVSETRIIPYRTTKKLERSYEVNESSIRNNEEAVRQKMKESSRIEGRRQCVARKQKYPFKQTLKEAGPKKI